MAEAEGNREEVERGCKKVGRSNEKEQEHHQEGKGRDGEFMGNLQEGEDKHMGTEGKIERLGSPNRKADISLYDSRTCKPQV